MKSLAEHEQVIEAGIGTFISVGETLLELRNNWSEYKLEAGYDSFSDYCESRWPQIPASTRYYQLDVAEVQSFLPVPVTDSHAAVLHKYFKDDAELIQETWDEVTTSSHKPTAKLVETISRKHWLMENDAELGEKVRLQEIAPDKAFALKQALDKLPQYYKEAVYEYGLEGEGVAPETLNALRSLEYYDREVALDVLRSGELNEVPLNKLTERDVTTALKRLTYENTQKRILDAVDKQKSDLKSGVVVLDGFDSWNIDPESQSLYFLFPNGTLKPEDVTKILTKNELGVYFICAATKNEPLLNFDGQGVKPSEANVKPKSLINYIKNSIL